MGNRDLLTSVWARALAAAFFAAASLASAPARADHALLVGVNRYPSLKAADLDGCVNDVHALATVLRKQGFAVRTLTEAEATRRQTLDALDALRKENRADERLVVYFAAHGTVVPGSGAALLLADAQESSTSSDLSADELSKAVGAIPARSRTILLDTCFSGGMLRSSQGVKALRPALKTRFHTRLLGGGAKDLVEVNGADTVRAVPSGTEICYLTASRGNEQAAEDEFDGAQRGVFTYYLLRELGSQPGAWGALLKRVASRMADHLADTQHPTLAPAFVDRRVFDNTPVDAAAAEESTAWNELNADRVRPDHLQVTMSPNRTTVEIGDAVSFMTRVQEGGYLLLLERGVSGNVNLLFPKSGKLEAARVTAGQVIEIPKAGGFYRPDAAGTERIKALLFAAPQTVEKVLAEFAAGRSVPRKRLQERLATVRVRPAGLVTSDIIFEVVRQADR